MRTLDRSQAWPPYPYVLLCQAIKPTVLIGSSGVGRTFTKEVVEAMASFNEVISRLSICLINGRDACPARRN